MNHRRVRTPLKHRATTRFHNTTNAEIVPQQRLNDYSSDGAVYVLNVRHLTLHLCFSDPCLVSTGHTESRSRDNSRPLLEL